MALRVVRTDHPPQRGPVQSSQPRRGTSFPWLQAFVLGGVAVLFLGMLVEIGLRVADLRANNLAGLQCVGSGTLLQGQKGLFILDSEAGYRMRPSTCVRLKTSEYDGVLKTNSKGMVGPELGAKAPGEFRIVVLGDSYAVGGQVPYAQTFPAVLERDLHNAGYSSVRVVNAGVGGYTTFNESRLLHEDLSLFRPNLVIVAAFLGNDVSENVLATAAGYRLAPEHPKGMTWGLEAARLVNDSGSWFPRNGLSAAASVPPAWNPGDPLPEPVGNSVNDGAVAPAVAAPPGGVRTLAHAAWDGVRANSLLLGRLFGEPTDPSVSTAPGAAPLAAEEEQLNLTSFEWTILRDIPHTYWLDVAWPLFGRYLSDARVTAESVDAPLVLMSIPEMSQVDDEMHARTMANFRFADSEVDWGRPQRELAAQAHAAGVPMLDLLSEFQTDPQRADLYLRIDTHFTAYGHAVTADALARYLTEGGYLKSLT